MPPYPAPENDVQDVSTFSAASMFGMLLTLNLCLLLQPQGSFIIYRPSGTLGRVAFFFWRLNPISCVIEAGVVFVGLVRTFWRAIKSDILVANLQAGAAGLLFLRSHPALHIRYLDSSLVGPAPTRGRAEVIIDIITLISVSASIIKIAASVVPWHFQVIAWCYTVDWIVVQLALVLSHCGSRNEKPDPKRLLQSAAFLQWGFGVVELYSSLFAVGVPVTGFVLYMDNLNEVWYNVLSTLTVAALLCTLSVHMFTLEPKIEKPGVIMLVLGLMATISALGMAFALYEEKGTYKPGWLDWLG